MISLISCIDSHNGIGLNGTIPWTLRPDMKHFKKLTTGSTVIMGRLTWDSIGSKPLPNRVNIVVTSQPHLIDTSAIACITLQDAIDIAKSLLKPIFIIGGSRIYKEAFALGASKVYLTRINKNYSCDATFPIESMTQFKPNIGDWIFHEGVRYRFETYERM